MVLFYFSQTVIQENPFTDSLSGRGDSPVSIGEPISESGHVRKHSNPFRPTEDGRSAWELEKQQFTAQMTLLREQLKAETTARVESQVRNNPEGMPLSPKVFLVSGSCLAVSGLSGQGSSNNQVQGWYVVQVVSENPLFCLHI